MKIVLIGSGNVAWNLGKLFVQHQHEVLQVIGRNAHTASALAYELNTESANYLSIINKDADIYVIAVKDDALQEIVTELKGFNKLVVHTSGAASMELLKNCSNTYGVLYPLQSLVYGAITVPEIPFLIQGNTDEVSHQIKLFAATLTQKSLFLKDVDKAKLHIAAVLVNNFTNHLYVLAEVWCAKNNLDFNLLLPLIEQTANRLKEHSPKALQTGPAIRNDTKTIQQHEALLQEDAYLLELYRLLTKGIQQQ